MNKEKVDNKATLLFSQLIKLNSAFPPKIMFPEDKLFENMKLLDTNNVVIGEIFKYPIFFWYPEQSIFFASKCIKCDSCTPVFKEYKFRLVQDLNHVTNLIFCRYKCTKLLQHFQPTMTIIYPTFHLFY